MNTLYQWAAVAVALPGCGELAAAIVAYVLAGYVQ